MSDRPKDDEATRVKAGRAPRPAAAADVSSMPRPAAQSILQSVLPDGGWNEGVKLNELEDEPSLRELKQGADKYSVHGVLGEGGMGKVYLARDEDLHRPVALKVSRKSDPASLARFVAEAQVMGQLHHPGIVPVFELGQSQDKRLFYAMPVVRGETLHEAIEGLRAGHAEAVTRWSLTRCMQVFIQVCQAVAYAHEKGVLHRDLKPANIMTGRHGEVQVLDWGIAKITRGGGIEVNPAASTQDETGFAMGTPGYMSPEQARGEQVDERADVFSLGGILYEMLTLLRPFDGSASDVFEGERREVPVAPRQAAPQRGIPLALEKACLKALSPRTSRRHPSVQALADDVQTWLEAETDRERRRQLADAKSAAAGALLAEHERLKGEVVRLEADADMKAKAACVEPWRPVADKREVVAAQDAVTRVRRELTSSASRAIATLTEALGFDPEHASARELLADYYWSRLRESESQGHPEDVAFFAGLTAAYQDGKYARELQGDGSLELTSDPPAAEVWLHDHVEEDLVLQPRHPRLLGLTPLPRTRLPMGSYLVLLKKGGFRDTRYPVFISRNKAWTGKVTLFTDEEIGAGFVHVPAGPFIAGGDPACRGMDLPRAEPWVDDFCMALHPVTNGEYLEYLNDLVDRDGLQAARARSPRRSWDAPETSFLVERRGRLALAEDGHGQTWLPGHPVCSVSFEDAEAHCAWRTEREGRDVRLATELEWEKSARGVDGRWFPWGHRFDPSCCNMAESRRPGEYLLVAVEDMEARFPADLSPHGVRGLAGNMQTWTSTRGESTRGTRITRGGSWAYNRFPSRCATRYEKIPQFVDNGIGFRVVAAVRRARE